MVTKPSLYPSYKKIAFIRRSKSWPRSGRMRLLTIVAQIPTCCPMKRLVDQQADLELDSKGNWEPVQNITEERFNVVVFSPAAQQPSSDIEDRLQAIQEIFNRSNQQTIKAIDLSCVKGHITFYNFEQSVLSSCSAYI